MSLSRPPVAVIPPPAPETRASARGGWRPLYAQWPTLAALVVLVLGWFVVSEAKWVSARVLPTPGSVWHAGVQIWTHQYGTATLPVQAMISSGRVLAGFSLATVAGVLVGVLTALVPAVRYFTEPLLSFFRPVPAFAFITVLIVWLGIGEEPKITLVFIGVFAPMTVYTTSAMSAMPKDLGEAARSLGASPTQVLLRVRLVAALPDILAGMRVLLALAWTGVMGAELIAATSGLGWMIWHGMRYLDTPVIFVGVITIAVIAGAMDALLASVSWRLVGSWAPRIRGI